MKRLMFALAIVAMCACIVAAADTAPKIMPTGMAKLHGDPAVKDFPAMKAATLMEKAADYAPQGGYAAGKEGTDLAYGSMMAHGFGTLGKWMGEAKTHPVGPAFAMFYDDPSKTEAGKLTSKVGFPVMGDVKGTDKVMIEEIPAMPMAVSLTYEGPYDGAANAWDAMMKYIPAHGYEPAGPAMEVYLKGPNDTKNPQEYVTEIRWPVKKIETKPEMPKQSKG